MNVYKNVINGETLQSVQDGAKANNQIWFTAL